jgi:hypothetical protein
MCFGKDRSRSLPDLVLVLGLPGFLLLAGYENLTAPLFAFRDNAELKWQFVLLVVASSP